MDGKRIIGVTGGVGAGKSTVLEVLRTEYKARILLADTIAHELMEPGTKGLLAVTKALGTGLSARMEPWTGTRWRRFCFRIPRPRKSWTA